MVTTRHTLSEGRAQETAQSNAPFHQGDDPPTSSDGDIPAEPIPNHKRSRSMFFGTTLRPTKRVRNSLEYIPPSRRRKTPESIVVAGDQDQPDRAGEKKKDDDIDEDEDTLLSKQLAFEAMNSFLQPRDHSALSTNPQPEPPSSANSMKRRRGRPKKHPLPVIAEQPQLSRRALGEIQTLAMETLGPVDDHDQKTDGVLDSVEVKTHISEPIERQKPLHLNHADDNVSHPSTASVKRGRGRPRKTPLPVAATNTMETVDAQNQPRVSDSVEVEDQLQRDADDNVDHELQQRREAVHEKEVGAMPIPEQPAQESDSESDEEFPPIEELNKPKQTKKQSIPLAQPELGPENTCSSPVLETDDLANGDDHRNLEEDDEETVWSEEDEEDDQPFHAPPNRRNNPPADPLFFQAPEVLDDPYEVEIKGSTISWLRALMGSPDWTGFKEDDTWARTILSPYRNQTGKKTATEEVGDFCGQLYGLKALFDQAPRTRAASHFEQNKYLRSVQSYLTEDMMQIRERFMDVEQYLVSNGIGHPKQRHQLKQDLFEYGIPMLVLVLSSAYCLGKRGGGDDADRDYEFSRFPSSAMFTTTRIQYLLRITGWLKRLGTKLAASSEVPNDASVNEVGSRLNIKVLKGKFAEILGHWEKTLQKALGELEHIRKRQAEKRARDEAIKKAKEDAKKAYLDQMHARDEAIQRAHQAAEEKERAKKEAFLEGLFPPTQQQRIASSQPSLKVEQGQKATRPSVGIPRSSGAVSSAAPSRHQQQQPESSDVSVQATSSRQQLEKVFWSREDNEWLLKQLRLTGPRVSDTQYEAWAVALRKPTFAEVRNQAEKIRVAAREVAYERDTVLEWWARIVYEDDD